MARIIQLIFNEEQVKALCPISQNLAGEYMASAMFEAQEIGLKNILGSRLLAKLKELEAQGEGAFPAAYEDLKGECINYLIYQTIVNLIGKVSFKIANIGVVRSTDEKVVLPSAEEINLQKDEYQANADFFCYELQKWILAHKDAFVELDACACEAIHANLLSMASCGVWLGGARGFEYRGDCECDL